ncbi:hypothetical protein DFH08DRAFT_822431 [Mycena albidolilacea]|uniref:Uncharacterized protein n=1 Tax=Mycena albidolilacea TaxID=1033008 RepID=A0AAD7ED49_9AGAR|nr:hypothetical protein DFH08DRAFT_822431 [Mycena albidolilacea]
MAVRTGLPDSPPASSETSSGTSGRESPRKKRSGLADTGKRHAKVDRMSWKPQRRRNAQHNNMRKVQRSLRESSHRFLRVGWVVQSDDQKKPKWICFPGTIGRKSFIPVFKPFYFRERRPAANSNSVDDILLHLVYRTSAS